MTNSLPLILFAACLLLPQTFGSTARAEEDYVPWGKVRFGMIEPQLRELYPEIRAAKGLDEGSAGSILASKNLVLSKQTFGPLESCGVHFILMQAQLLRINFYCVKYEVEEVRQALEDRYGFPVFRDQMEMAWADGPARIGLNLNSGFFSISHAEKSAALVRSVLGAGALEPPRLPKLEDKGGAESADEGSEPEPVRPDDGAGKDGEDSEDKSEE